MVLPDYDLASIFGGDWPLVVETAFSCQPRSPDAPSWVTRSSTEPSVGTRCCQKKLPGHLPSNHSNCNSKSLTLLIFYTCTQTDTSIALSLCRFIFHSVLLTGAWYFFMLPSKTHSVAVLDSTVKFAFTRVTVFNACSPSLRMSLCA